MIGFIFQKAYGTVQRDIIYHLSFINLFLWLIKICKPANHSNLHFIYTLRSETAYLLAWLSREGNRFVTSLLLVPDTETIFSLLYSKSLPWTKSSMLADTIRKNKMRGTHPAFTFNVAPFPPFVVLSVGSVFQDVLCTTIPLTGNCYLLEETSKLCTTRWPNAKC